MSLIEPVFRPPSEANSLILQVTNGCSWNKCAFCEMYTAPQKQFSTKPIEKIIDDLNVSKNQTQHVRRVFLADGDAMALSTRRLIEILEAVNRCFPELNRVSSYCLPRNVAKKSVDELKELNDLGLKLLYVGAESGDDKLLSLIDKGESFKSISNALDKIRHAGIKSSVMLLNGLGGHLYSHQHAINSAKLVNNSPPDYLSTLVVSFPLGKDRFLSHFSADFRLLSTIELFKELEIFIEHTSLVNTIFRSDHASNYLALKGVLGKDRERFLTLLQTAQHSPDQLNLREEWQRGL